MWKRAFDPRNSLWQTISKLTDIVGLSLLWVFLSLPIITLGSSTTALYDCTFHCIRGSEPGCYNRFFRVFKENFKTSAFTMLLWIILGGAFFTLNYLLWLGGSAGNGTLAMLFLATRVLLFVPIGVFCWVFPLLSRFRLDFKTLSLTAFKIAFGHLPSSFVIVLIMSEGANLCVQYWWPVLIAPALIALLWSLFMERVFKKYVPTPED